MKKLNFKKMLNLRSFALIGILAMAVFAISCEDDSDVYGSMAETEIKSGKGVKPGDMTIADIVVSAADDGEFTILKQLLMDYGLVEVFNSREQYTVFAPTDAAFNALFEYLANNNIELTDEQIANTLLYHVAEGRRAANSVLAKNDDQMKEIETLLGQTFSVDSGGNIYTASMGMSAIIVAGDGAGPGMTYNISASNGIIHVINAVMVPEL